MAVIREDSDVLIIEIGYGLLFFVSITKKHDQDGHAKEMLLLATQAADIIKMIVLFQRR